ncbi:MAG: ComF family protein [Kiritimatiellae bacterium]|nr:ComF family protein [Kiritimatiellia bacterium]
MCGEKCEGQICEGCAGRLSARRPDRDCANCGKTIIATDAAAGSVHPVCNNCRKSKPAFTAARSAVDYDGPAREIAKGLKYHKLRGLAPLMAEWMHGCVLANWPEERFDIVCPVPLHFFREAERGYNQAALVAAALARRLGVDLGERMLRRTRWTGTQTKLDASSRRKNMAGVFKVRHGFEDSIPGKTVLLVDDVMTTGSTLDSAASALRAAGAGRVFALSFARG